MSETPQQLMKIALSLNNDEKPETESQMEIPAAKVRSGLAELELQTSRAMQRLENIKSIPENPIALPTLGLLHQERKAPAEIFSFLETLIAQSDQTDDDSEFFILPPLDEVSHLALLSHSIVAYMSHLDYRKLSKITSKICNDTNRWLAHLFRFMDANASYHIDSTESILRAVRLAIVTRCPGYLEGGVPALANPCLYISENSSLVGLQYACRQLGLPLHCIRLVPSNTTFGAIGAMDISALQKIIASDLVANRTPLFLIADTGSSMCGYVDNIMRLQDVCRANSIWLHCRGHSLAAIAVTQGSGEVKPIADSISLNLGSWLGIPNLPVALLHRQIQNVALSVFESDPVLSRRLSSLSLWTTLQALGRDTISARIIKAFDSCRIMYDIVSRCPGIRVLSKAPGGETKTTISDLVMKPINFPLLFETAIAVVVFQFDGSQSDSTDENSIDQNSTNASASQDLTQNIINKSIEKVANISYFDKLNSWLGQNLQRDCSDVELEIVDHQIYGTCIRFCPLELGLGDSAPSLEMLENVASCLEAQIEILRATVKHRGTLNRLVERNEVLRLVHLTDWAGLGGVRFVPEGWETLLTDQAKTELNKLNTDLVETLRNTDNAFSLGEADGLICVRFGMVTEDTDVEELLELVISVGKRVQENSKVLDTMSEIVKKGIETATADLQRESEEKLWSDGILRHVPVFGQVVNWWSPPKETGIKGRSLNLTQGVVESTENIYKYHMQLAGSGNQIHGTKSPPTPMVQTSMVSASHSRNVSQSSGTSNADTATQPPAPV